MPYNSKEKLYAAQKQHRERNKVKVLEYLLEHPCTVCGENDPIVLDFDHLDRETKFKEVSRMLSGHYSWKKIFEEINKCRVLCANCHRRHTYSQLNHWGKTQ